MPTYAELRQRVLATLAPGVAAEPVRWGLAYAALPGGRAGGGRGDSPSIEAGRKFLGDARK
jgi:hypothetical protein